MALLLLGCSNGVPVFTDSPSNSISQTNSSSGGINSGAAVMAGSQFKVYGVTGLTVEPNTMAGSQFKIKIQRNN